MRQSLLGSHPHPRWLVHLRQRCLISFYLLRGIEDSRVADLSLRKLQDANRKKVLVIDILKVVIS